MSEVLKRLNTHTQIKLFLLAISSSFCKLLIYTVLAISLGSLGVTETNCYLTIFMHFSFIWNFDRISAKYKSEKTLDNRLCGYKSLVFFLHFPTCSVLQCLIRTDSVEQFS